MKNPTIETGASRLAGLAVLAFAGFGAGIGLMHVLRPDYALANHMVSDYAVGPWGAVMTGAFACASIGCLALAIGLVRSRLVSGVGWLVAALFAVAAVGLRHFLLAMFGLFGAQFSLAEDAEWSSVGKSPSIEAEGESAVASPDGRLRVIGMPIGLRLDSARGVSIDLPVAALPPLWEVNWAPNSLVFAVNASDGGGIGTWDSTLFKVKSSGSVNAFLVSPLVRRAAHTFARCTTHEKINVALVGWEENGAIAHVIVEVPPHSPPASE